MKLEDLTDEDKDILRYEDQAGSLEYVPDTQIATDRRRWVVRTERIYRDTMTDKLYCFSWDDPATESQEYEPDSANFYEVMATVVPKTIYIKV